MNTSSTYRVIAVHLYNDYSGSPLIFSQWLQHAVRKGNEIILHTSNTKGKLDQVLVHKRVGFDYRPSKIKLLTLAKFLWVQVLLFCRILFVSPKNTTVYVNTILPFGAILAAWVRRIPVICHIHEVSVKPRLLNGFLQGVARRFSNQMVFVSEYVANSSNAPYHKASVVPNSLSPEFKSLMISPLKRVQNSSFTVLMLASVKTYKGLAQYLQLAQTLPQIEFELVLNGSESDIESFFGSNNIPQNLLIWPAQKDVHPFYQRADLVLNLSLPDQWIETFGMTALEAMAYEIPVIVPYIGGIAELVIDGSCGYHCDPYSIDVLKEQILKLQNDPELYSKMAASAKERESEYSFRDFASNIDQIVAQALLTKNPNWGHENQSGIVMRT